MRHPERRRATLADLDEVPETMVGQIIEGALIVLPRPASAHVWTSSNIGTDINGRFGRRGPPGGWWILDEPELHLDGDVLVPNLAGWRRERMPHFANQPAFTLAPDWVLEVLSPSTASIDRISKSRIYARAGVGWLWFVDPLARTVEVCRLQGDAWLRVAAFGAGEPVRAEPFDAVEFDTTDWFVPDEVTSG